MPEEKWEATMKHAQTCEPDSRLSLFVHISSDQKKTGVVFNAIAQIMGLFSEPGYNPYVNLSEKEKADARMLVVSAYKHWEEVKYFDDDISMHAYWESINAASTPDTSPSPLFLCNETSTSYDVPGMSFYNSEGELFHNTTSLVHGSSQFTDSLPLQNANYGSTSQLRFSDAYAQSSVPSLCPSSSAPYLGSDSANNMLIYEQLCSLPDFPLGEQLWVNEDSGCILDYQEEDVQRILACVGSVAAQRRWRMLFSVMTWFILRKRTAASDVVSSERIQAPKRSRIF